MNNRTNHTHLPRPLKGIYNLTAGGWHIWNTYHKQPQWLAEAISPREYLNVSIRSVEMPWDPMSDAARVFQDFAEGNRSQSCSERHMWINVIALRDQAVLYLEVASSRFSAMKMVAG